MDYSNREGRRKSNLSIGNPFDRFKWGGKALDAIYASPGAAVLLERAKELYKEHAGAFMRDHGIPEDVCAPPPLCLTSCPTKQHPLLYMDHQWAPSSSNNPAVP